MKADATTRAFLVRTNLFTAFGYYTFFEKYHAQDFAPQLNIQDTQHLLTLSLLSATISLTFYFKSKKIIFISQIIFCIILIYTNLFNNNIRTSIPQILNFPWLFSHVVIIILAYGLFTLCALISMVTFVVTDTSAHLCLTELSRHLLISAVLLLCIGIMIGAIL